MPSVTRPRRKSSRISSPLAQSPAPAPERRKEKARNLLEEWRAGKDEPDVALHPPKSQQNPEPTKSASADAAGPAPWIEPPVLNRPSFEDYGLERHGVLMHMQPLGTLPTAKHKAKVRGEADKRLQIVKDGLEPISEDGRESGETTPALEKSVPEPQIATREGTRQSGRKNKDSEYVPSKVKKAPSRPARIVTSAEAPPVAVHGTPNSRTPAGRQRLELVVDAAVKKAEEVGNPGLGHAVRQIFLESLQDPHLRVLLDAILDQRSTHEQRSEFQNYVKRIKKQIRSEEPSENNQNLATPADMTTSTLTGDASKLAQVVDRSARQNSTVANPVSEPESRARSKPLKEHTTNGDQAKANGMASKDDNPRRSRSGSTSSMSSLTSIASSDEKLAKDPPLMTAPRENVVKQAKGRGIGQTNGRRSQQPPSKANKDGAPTSAPSADSKRSSTDAGLSDEEDQATNTKRQKLRQAQIFGDYHVELSSLRDGPVINERSKNSASSKAAKTLRTPNKAQKLLPRDEGDDANSLVSLSLPAESANQSRSGTPHLPARPAKRAKMAARIKMSPVKKKTGVIAGIARPSGARASPIGYDDNEELSDNNDFCSACGGSGFLLCCDGCDRSFHFTCCDPPLDYNASSLDEPWFCYTCEAKRNGLQKYARSLFGPLLGLMDKANPSSFALPQNIRDFFTGVKTGPEGEYEEVALQKSNKSRPGYDELPDFTRLKDSKGQVVLCSHCGGSSLNNRQIIACDYCPAQFHLDCLDPPMANPPPNGSNGKRPMWMCPRHIEHDLRAPSPGPRGTQSVLRRIHRIRRPKDAKIIDVSLNRGFKNNGCIEIENESSDDEEFYQDESASGVVYRVPEKGVVLDFVAMAKQPRQTRQVSPARPRFPVEDPQNFVGRPFKEQRAALTLTQLAQREGELGLSSDRIAVLVQSLIAESPCDVAAAISADENARTVNKPVLPTPLSSTAADQPPSEAEKKELLALQELIRKRLGQV